MFSLLSSTLYTDFGFNFVIISYTSLSGVDAPEVTPNLLIFINHSGFISSNELIKYELVPESIATSLSLLQLD